MTNSDVSRFALEHVVRYENRHGREYLPDERTHGEGCDIITQGKDGKKRYIEIKSTAKRRHPNRWLEETQYKALSGQRDFWIYLVLDVTKESAKIRPVHKSEWPKKPIRESIKYWYKIDESLQCDAEEERA